MNKQDDHQDRKTEGGKGDYFAQDMNGYRDSGYWGKSGCCQAPVMRIQGKDYCEECKKPKERWYNDL